MVHSSGANIDVWEFDELVQVVEEFKGIKRALNRIITRFTSPPRRWKRHDSRQNQPNFHKQKHARNNKKRRKIKYNFPQSSSKWRVKVPLRSQSRQAANRPFTNRSLLAAIRPLCRVPVLLRALTRFHRFAVKITRRISFRTFLVGWWTCDCPVNQKHSKPF